MAKYGIQILSNTGSFEIGFYPDEKVVNYSNVTEIIKTVLNDDGSVFYYEERKTDPSQEDYIKYIQEYDPENNQEVVEEKVFESEDERNSFYDTYNF
jgi:DNA-directed RNA polymerase subunit F